MRKAATIEVVKVANAREGKVFFKCPVGGFASLRPGICLKCGELLMIVGASPASTDGCDEGHAPVDRPDSGEQSWAGVAE
ncbi:MAG: hypothetical protein H0T45_05860 [Pyrinomonadaceae bacterium]|nr:hypothetical protein [Pyrinomonadaceae bacterium]MDQ3133822.1 hypothetical protein [Acidobacteriota bacterium]